MIERSMHEATIHLISKETESRRKLLKKALRGLANRVTFYFMEDFESATPSERSSFVITDDLPKVMGQNGSIRVEKVTFDSEMSLSCDYQQTLC